MCIQQGGDVVSTISSECAYSRLVTLLAPFPQRKEGPGLQAPAGPFSLWSLHIFPTALGVFFWSSGFSWYQPFSPSLPLLSQVSHKRDSESQIVSLPG